MVWRELHYAGMEKNGNKVLEGKQNRTMAELKTNGVEVHLFEVLESAKYIYQGVVTLCGVPYQEDQKDETGAVSTWFSGKKVMACFQLKSETVTLFPFLTRNSGDPQKLSVLK